jgi:ligand-binding sensor domain-containing protein/signal transduction histidine kinase
LFQDILFMKIYISVLFTFILTSCLLSQKIRFERITIKEGLSRNSINSICQDSTGFMWFGTYSGLNRYDGYNYKVFKHESNNPKSLTNDFIGPLCIDKFNQLWIGTANGLNQYNNEKENFIRYYHNPDDPGSISHNNITCLLVDRSGNLWIGTFGGGINKLELSPDLSRRNKHQNDNQDKLEFIHYHYFDAKVDNEDWDIINYIYEDKFGFIWICSRYGLTKFDPLKNKFTNYFHQPADVSSLSSNIPTKVCEDKYGDLWVGTWDAGLNRFDREKELFVRYTIDKSNKNTFGIEFIIELFKDKSNDLWIGTYGNGLAKLNFRHNLPKNNVSIKKLYDFVIYKHNPYDPNSISCNDITAIFEDRSNVLWIGTYWGGLNKFDRRKSNIVCYSSGPTDPNSLNQNVIFTIFKDHHDVLWLGTSTSGINLFDLRTKRFSYFKNNPNDLTSLMDNTVITIYEGKDHTIWIGTSCGLNEFVPSEKNFISYLIHPNQSTTTNVFSICEDRFGYLWIGTYGNGLYKFDRKTKHVINYRFNISDSNSIGDNIIWAIHEDQYGDLWIGTNSGGLNMFDRENNRFIRYTHNNSGITDNKVLVIYEDKSGNLWLGTTLGLNKLIRGNNKKGFHTFIHFTKEDGLTSNTIHGILEDDHGNLWISADYGISRFNPNTKTFKNFDLSDGLLDNEFSVNSCFKNGKNGEMYFGGINGFNIFHPDSLKDNLILPNVVITDLKIFNKSVPIGKEINGHMILDKSITYSKEIKLDYKNNVFSIEFAALHFSSPTQNLYAYKLEGFEKDWNFVDAKQRTVTYTNLNPGKYSFFVKASNNDGKWNEQGAMLNIIVTPPFWETWWFGSLIILLVILMFILIHILRIRRIRKINRKLEEHVAKRTKELKMINQELEAFTYAVSHDLRAPLRGMSGFSEILIEEYKDKLDEKVKDYLHRINAAGKHMDSLIANMLKLSKITRSKLVMEQVDLSSIVESIIEDLKQEEPNRKVVVNITKSLLVYGDKALLKIMFQNLLGNAWKFTSRKSETVIEFGKTFYNKERVFFLKDNGIGFDNKFADKIFEAFQRLKNDFEGTGLGLATVQRIILRHGGKIWAEGKTNIGATFYFTLGS